MAALEAAAFYGTTALPLNRAGWRCLDCRAWGGAHASWCTWRPGCRDPKCPGHV